MLLNPALRGGARRGPHRALGVVGRDLSSRSDGGRLARADWTRRRFAKLSKPGPGAVASKAEAPEPRCY